MALAELFFVWKVRAKKKELFKGRSSNQGVVRGLKRAGKRDRTP